MDVQTKVIVAVAGGVAGWIGTKALTSTWKAVTGNTAPDDPDDMDRGMAEAVIFAALSGAFIGIVRTLATRGTAKYIASRPARATATGMNRPV